MCELKVRHGDFHQLAMLVSIGYVTDLNVFLFYFVTLCGIEYGASMRLLIFLVEILLQRVGIVASVD